MYRDRREINGKNFEIKKIALPDWSHGMSSIHWESCIPAMRGLMRDCPRWISSRQIFGVCIISSNCSCKAFLLLESVLFLCIRIQAKGQHKQLLHFIHIWIWPNVTVVLFTHFSQEMLLGTSKTFSIGWDDTQSPDKDPRLWLRNSSTDHPLLGIMKCRVVEVEVEVVRVSVRVYCHLVYTRLVSYSFSFSLPWIPKLKTLNRIPNHNPRP